MTLFIPVFLLGFFSRVLYDRASAIASAKWHALTDVRLNEPDTDPPPDAELPTEPTHQVPSEPPAARDPRVTHVFDSVPTFVHEDAERIIRERGIGWGGSA